MCNMALNYDLSKVSKPNYKRMQNHPLWTTNYFTMEIGMIACQNHNGKVTLENWHAIAQTIINARIYTDDSGKYGFHAGKYTISDIRYGVYLHIGSEFYIGY